MTVLKRLWRWVSGADLPEPYRCPWGCASEREGWHFVNCRIFED